MTVYTRCMIVHGVHICMFESLQHEGLYVGDLLYGISIWLARPLTKNKLWKILQKMGIPDPLTCLLRNLCASQEAAVRTGHGTMNWFQIGKGVCQGCILSPCLFNLNAEYIEMPGRLTHKLESRLLGEISITSDTEMILPLRKKVKRS